MTDWWFGFGPPRLISTPPREEFVAEVQRELRSIVQRRTGQRIVPPAVINELHQVMRARGLAHPHDEPMFFLVAATELRHTMAAEARARRLAMSEAEASQLVSLDEAMDELRRHDSRQALVADLRIFAGFDAERSAEALAINSRTVKRDWAAARTWLLECLKDGSILP